ncbi:Fur family transcriptional regulator [Paenibacillus aurantiacus]|uniref:Fur family transcriptional regulator n=1 Tax=Paenibacillus aurantiacus TaxID=1936118 RepID=A0ABV5KHD9_9BACL
MMEIAERLDQITRVMETRGYRLTKQRAVTVEILLREKGALTAEEVFDLVRRQYPPIGMATVYRTLELLGELGIVYKIVASDRSVRFACQHDRSGHAKPCLICSECGQSSELNGHALGELESLVQRVFGCNLVDDAIYFTGKACLRTDCHNRSVS